VISKACRGDRLDLDRLVKANTCVVDAERHMPPEIAVSIEPANLRIKGGAERTASIVLTNTASTDTSLFLDCRRP
jgi:hypothetical protein